MENMECLVCCNSFELEDVEICKNCNKCICKCCLEKQKKQSLLNRNFNTNDICFLNNIGFFSVRCHSCDNKFKIYLVSNKTHYEVLGYDKNNNLYKLMRNEKILYKYKNLDLLYSNVFFGYLPETKYPSIFEEDDKEKICKNIKYYIFNVEDNTEKMIFPNNL